MISSINCTIEKVSAHQVGNKTDGDDLRLSKSLLDIDDEVTRDLMMRFFLHSFNNPEYYCLTSTTGDFTTNPLYRFAGQVFEEDYDFHKVTQQIARHLFEISVHPQIKPGDLFVAYLKDIVVEDEVTDAIGIFKSENTQSFLKLDSTRENFSLHSDSGINIDRLDKGCLIFNTDKENGYKVCIVDKANKSDEARYWKDTFLQLKERSDNFHHTKEFLSIAQSYVTRQLPEDFQVVKADQIDYLNRSVDYFKNNETFNQNDFEQKVFQHENVINSFRNFDKSYRQNFDVAIEDEFEISPQAVKKQGKIFKSILKLDKNFHVYIHGNRDMIEQGVDENGRKYYKLYYEQEA